MSLCFIININVRKGPIAYSKYNYHHRYILWDDNDDENLLFSHYTFHYLLVLALYWSPRQVTHFLDHVTYMFHQKYQCKDKIEHIISIFYETIFMMMKICYSLIKHLQSSLNYKLVLALIWSSLRPNAHYLLEIEQLSMCYETINNDVMLWNCIILFYTLFLLLSRNTTCLKPSESFLPLVSTFHNLLYPIYLTLCSDVST